MRAMRCPSGSTAAVVALVAIASCGGGSEAQGPDALVVAPASVALIVGQSAQVTAKLTRDGADVAGGTIEWSSSDPARATVDARATSATIAAVAPGSATITASSGGLSATIDVAISAAALQQIAISPATASIAAGTTTAISVTATYSNQTTVEVGPQVTWTSAQPAIASATGNVLTGFAKGETMLSAAYLGQMATARVTVTDPVLRSIDIAPSMPTIIVGQSQAFTASGFFSDATTKDITTAVAWTSSADDVATISNAAGSQGRAAGLAEGETTISATSGRLTGTTLLTVNPLSLQGDEPLSRQGDDP
jgi:trimeric autotransporter adhesin